MRACIRWMFLSGAAWIVTMPAAAIVSASFYLLAALVA